MSNLEGGGRSQRKFKREENPGKIRWGGGGETIVHRVKIIRKKTAISFKERKRRGGREAANLCLK